MKRLLVLCVAALPAASLAAQCGIVADLTSGNINNGNIGGLVAAFGNELYFYGHFPQTGGELWKWTPSGGAQIVADLAAGAGNTIPQAITPCLTKSGPLVFFSGSEIGHGRELYVSDGTSSGTGRLLEISPGGASSNPYGFCAADGLVYFNAADQSTGEELWVSDGTSGGTQRLSDFSPGSGNGRPRYMFAFDDRVVFEAYTPTTGRELFISDGTVAGTGLLRDINPGTSNSSPGGFTRFGDHVYFIATSAAHGREIWRTDGTTAGTTMMADLFPLGSFGPFDLTVCGEQLFFHEFTGSNTGEVWVTDGTPAGTANLTSSMFVTGKELTCSGDRVFFQGSEFSGGAEPWVTDGTIAGTQSLGDLVVGGSSNPHRFTACGAGVMFVARVATFGELWFSDGTPAGTTHVCTLDPGGSANPDMLSMCRGRLIFEAYSPAFGRELFGVQTPGASLADLGGGSGPGWSTLSTSSGAVPILGSTVDIEGRGPAGHVGFLLAGGPGLPVAAPILPALIDGGHDWTGLLAGTAITVGTATMANFTVPFAIPNMAVFEGQTFQFQTVWANASAVPTLQVSNGLQLTVGTPAPH